jgi:hypothetical protein
MDGMNTAERHGTERSLDAGKQAKPPKKVLNLDVQLSLLATGVNILELGQRVRPSAASCAAMTNSCFFLRRHRIPRFRN